MRQTVLLSLLVLAVALPGRSRADEANRDEGPIHDELRKLRKELVDAVNKNDVDALLSHLDDKVMVTWLT
jgi:hypothetical protein